LIADLAEVGVGRPAPLEAKNTTAPLMRQSAKRIQAIGKIVTKPTVEEGFDEG